MAMRIFLIGLGLFVSFNSFCQTPEWFKERVFSKPSKTNAPPRWVKKYGNDFKFEPNFTFSPILVSEQPEIRAKEVIEMAMKTVRDAGLNWETPIKGHYYLANYVEDFSDYKDLSKSLLTGSSFIWLVWQDFDGWRITLWMGHDKWYISLMD